MAPDAINVAIAEWRGWVKTGDRGAMWHPTLCRGAIIPDSELDRTRIKINLDECKAKGRTPNYYEDLNAIAEAEGALLTAQHHHYLCKLERLLGFCSGPGGWDMDAESLWAMVHATSPQRCEALLRTLNLWKE